MKQIIYILTFVTLFLGSCTEKLDLEYTGKTSNKLVVDGGITTDTTAHTIQLFRTIDYSSAALKPEEGAIVSISDGVKTISLYEAEPGIYRTDSTVYGEVGKRYTLDIELLNGEKYAGTDELLTISTIDSIRVVKEYNSVIDATHHIVYFFGQEPETQGNSYMWNLYFDKELYTDTLDEVAFETDELYNGNYIANADLFWIQEEEIDKDTLDVTLEMFSLSLEYYDFLLNVMSETAWRGGPFDATPANVPSNIKGAVGFFYASAIQRKTVRYIASQDAITVP